MALGQSIRNAVGTAWRGILSAVAAGQSGVAAVASAVRQLGQAAAPPVLLDTSVVDQLAGLANGIEAARQALSAAGDDEPITASMISLAPWSMDLNAYNTAPSWDFNIEYNVEGQSEPVFRVLAGVSSLPITAGDARQLAQVNAGALAGPEGTSPALSGAQATVASISITVAPHRA